jgi:type IV pilus assembly protein PilE
MGYGAGGWPVNTLSGYYQLSVCVPATAVCDPVPAANLPPVPSYAITATAIGSQAKDTQCLTLGIDSTGQQFSTGTNTAQQCWGN